MKIEDYLAVFMGLIIIVLIPLLFFYFIDDIVYILEVIFDYTYAKWPNLIDFLYDNPLLGSIYILGGLFITLLIISILIRIYKEI